MKLKQITMIGFCIVFIVLCFCDLSTFLNAGQEGLKLIYRAVLSILFPFFVISGVLINLLPTNKFSVIALSLFSGYPNGARLTALLYKQNAITKEQAKEWIITTSTASPVFTIATVGAVLLGDVWTGVLIFAAMVLGAFANAAIWRKEKPIKMSKLPVANKALNFNEVLYNSTKTILNVCGIILICYIIAALLRLPPEISGLVEMTTGVSQIAVPHIICFLLSFGGISIALQSFIFTNDIGISPFYYFAFKFTHAILATAIFTMLNLNFVL